MQVIKMVKLLNKRTCIYKQFYCLVKAVTL